MQGATARCPVCGKSFLVAATHKDFKKILENPVYPYYCDACQIRIQLEAQRERFNEIFHRDIYPTLYKD